MAKLNKFVIWAVAVILGIPLGLFFGVILMEGYTSLEKALRPKGTGMAPIMNLTTYIEKRGDENHILFFPSPHHLEAYKIIKRNEDRIPKKRLVELYEQTKDPKIKGHLVLLLATSIERSDREEDLRQDNNE